MNGGGYLLDTNIVSALWDAEHRAHDETRERLATLGREALVFVSVITLGEVAFGLQAASGLSASRRDEISNATASHKAVLDVVSDVVRVYGQLRAALFAKYAPKTLRRRKEKRPEALVDAVTAQSLGIQENDLWIFSTGLAYQLPVITRDGGMERLYEVAIEAFPEQRDSLIVWPDTSTSE